MNVVIVIGIVCDVEVHGLTSMHERRDSYLHWLIPRRWIPPQFVTKNLSFEYSKSARLFKIDFCFQLHKTGNLVLSSAFHMLIFVVSDTDRCMATRWRKDSKKRWGLRKLMTTSLPKMTTSIDCWSRTYFLRTLGSLYPQILQKVCMGCIHLYRCFELISNRWKYKRYYVFV